MYPINCSRYKLESVVLYICLFFNYLHYFSLWTFIISVQKVKSPPAEEENKNEDIQEPSDEVKVDKPKVKKKKKPKLEPPDEKTTEEKNDEETLDSAERKDTTEKLETEIDEEAAEVFHYITFL